MEPAGQPAQSLSPDNPKFPQKVREILHKAQSAWLKNTEVCDVLLHYSEYNLPVARDPPHLPPGGSLFLFDRRAVRFFRKDAHNWRKKADGKTVRETHEKLKVGNVEMLNCYYAHADTEEGQQQTTRLQRRCYWLLESEDDIVLVHYLNIDKAKGKTEDTWAAPDSDMSRRPGFTVTSGGIHNIQALPHALHLPGQQQHHLPMQHGLESYIPLMPSLSLDSFFASCDEREAAAQRAQQPPAMMENVLPAWGEDLNNAPGGSLQAAADWQAMLRGESLGMSEGVPALVEHQGGMMMIEPGSGQQPDSWAQDVPAAMRTPSLEARQARAAALLRQNMELQQRQSSLERRAAFQKGLMAANRDHMQAAAAAAMLQQQGGQGNGQPPLSLTALQQRIIAAARQGQPGAQAQLQNLLRHQDLSAAQAMAAGMFGQMSQQTFNNQMPPPPPMGQQPRPPPGQPGQGNQQQGAFSGRLPPLQQPGGFQSPQPRPVAADWARAYRDQQNKAAQAAIARSAKWGTTEPSGRPSPSRQGSQGSGQLETLGSAGAGGLPSRPPLSGVSDSPRPTKLDALLHAQQLAQQQQQQQQQLQLQQQQQQHQSSSSGHEGRSGAAGLADRRALSGQLPATQSAAQFGINAAQVKVEASNSEGTVTGVPRNRESDAARLAQALALETQVRGVDGQIREQLTMATSGTRTASLDSRVQRLGSDVQQLEAESQRLLSQTETAQPNGRSEASSYGGGQGGQTVHSLELLDFSPNWDFTLGGSKILVTCREADGEVSSSSPVCIMFDKEEVPATRLQRGVYRCFAPPHEAGTVSLSITWGNGSPCSNTQPFTYRVTPQTARTQDDLARAAIPDRDLQLRLIHMLMGGRSSNAGPTQSNSTSSDSGNRRMHSSSSVTPGCDDVAPEIDAATLNMLPDDSREALLQRLLEQKLRSFAMQVKEEKARGGSGWPATYTVNKRAQSGLALIHILAALGYDWGLQVLLPLGAKLNLQDAWGRTALHWAAAYACEASVVLLLVRGAHAAPLSHGTEAQPPLAPGDMAAAAGHIGLAAFLSEHALVQLMKDHNVTLEDPMEARDAGENMSLRKRARSLRRADSASELPLLRETMATPASLLSISDDGGASPGDVLAKAKRMAEHVGKAQHRSANRRAILEQSRLRRHRKESAALSRIEKRLEEWRKIHVEAQEGGQSNPALVQLGQRIARLNAAIKEAIQSSIGTTAPGSCAPVSEVEEVVAQLPAARPSEVVDYGSDSDLPMMRGDTLARRRSIYHLRDSRRRDSITKIKGMNTDEAIRAFLTAGTRQGGKANEAGPSASDMRELRSLSISFSLMGPPIGVSLPDSDLKDLRYFLDCRSIPSLKDGKLIQQKSRPFGSLKDVEAPHDQRQSSLPAGNDPPGRSKSFNPCMLQRAVAHIEQLGSSQTGYAQYMRLRQAYIQLTTHQPNSAYKQARRGSLSFAV